MPCYICDRPVDEPRLDPRDMKTVPCSTCEQIIQEAAQVDSDEDVYTYIDSDLEDYNEELGNRFYLNGGL